MINLGNGVYRPLEEINDGLRLVKLVNERIPIIKHNEQAAIQNNYYS